jgi:hypothetical protein
VLADRVDRLQAGTDRLLARAAGWTKNSFNATSLETVSLRGRQAEMEVFEIN